MHWIEIGNTKGELSMLYIHRFTVTVFIHTCVFEEVSSVAW